MTQWQLISIPLAGGVDTKTDEALVDTSKVLELENGVFSVKDRRNKRTSITKRNGYEEVLPSGTTEALVTSGNQLLSFSGTDAFSYNEQAGENVSVGKCETVQVRQSPIVRNGSFVDGADSVDANGVRVVVYIQNSRSICELIDIETNTVFLVEDNGPTFTNQKLCVVGDYVHWFYYDAAAFSIFLRVINTANRTIGSPVLVSSSAQDLYYDVSSDTQKSVIAFVDSGGVGVAYYTKTGAQGSPLANGLPAPIVIPLSGGTLVTWIAVRYLENTPTGDIVLVGWTEDQLTIYFNALREDFTSVAGTTTYFSGGGTDDPVRAFTFAYDGDQRVDVFSEGARPPAAYDSIYAGYADWLGNTVQGPAIFATNAIIAAKAFYQNGRCHVPFYRKSETLVNGTLVPSTQSVVLVGYSGDDTRRNYQTAKLNYGLAGEQDLYLFEVAGGNTKGQLPESLVSGGVVSFCLPIVTRLTTQDENFVTVPGVQLTTLNFQAPDSHYANPLGKSTFMGGGFVWQWDGRKWTESGFHYGPEVLSVNVSAGTGSIGIGLYQYAAIFSWINAQGEVERSATSIPISVNVASASSTVAIELTCYNTTQKESFFSASNVKIELYRSIANAPSGAPLYLVTSIDNVLDATSVTIGDINADSSIDQNEIIYTTGGVLDNIAPNAGDIVETYKNRIICNDPADDQLTWISKEYIAGSSVEFSDFLTFRTPDIGGPITGYKQMDDKLLIFKKNLIFVTSGDGPNNTGTEFGLFPPELVASDTGCDNASSIVLTPVGVMFKSAKGFYLMNRSLQLQYIGQDVESFNFQSVTGATMVEDRNQVRFLTDAGLTLVYDYFYQQWSTFTNHQGLDAVMWRETYTYLRNDGAIWRETDGRYLDKNTAIKLKIKTPWIKLMAAKNQAVPLGPQSFFRVRRFAFLGRYASKHYLQVGVAYDYRPDVQQTYYFNTETRLTTPAGQYGNDAYYGETTPYGGNDGADIVYQFRARTARQKCESIQFIIEDIAQPTNGESYGITDLSLEVGLKQGLNKMGALKTVQGG
jgi:hypothetical protein